MIRCCKLFGIKKLGIKAFFHGIQWAQKQEKSVKYPCRSLAPGIKKYRRTEVYNLPHQSKHLLPSWKFFNVQLTQGVWMSFENPLNCLNPSFRPKVWLCVTKWCEMIAQCCKKRENSGFFSFVVTFFQVSVKYYCFFPYKITQCAVFLANFIKGKER